MHYTGETDPYDPQARPITHFTISPMQNHRPHVHEKPFVNTPDTDPTEPTLTIILAAFAAGLLLGATLLGTAIYALT